MSRLMLVITTAVLSQLAFAQTYTHKTLYNFGASASDGKNPYSSLVMDTAGNLYGTTSIGGGSAACSGGCGTVFRVNYRGKETILHKFVNTDGANPLSGLTIDSANNLYGVTSAGGLVNQGTAFKVTAAGRFSVLHQFGRLANDGLIPQGPLAIDSLGNLYGTTYAGGTSNSGTVYRLSSRGVETILYNFNSTLPEGSNPAGNIILDTAGNLYSTTANGGVNGTGMLFQLSPSNVETVLYSFCSQTDCVDGGYPSYITQDTAGNIYGEAGKNGIIFQFSGGVETPIFSFCLSGGIDCQNGGSGLGPLTLANGSLYGTGLQDGVSQVAYSLTPTGDAQQLYTFETFADGTEPFGGVIMGKGGNFFGTTYAGGTHGGGTVFELIVH